MTAKQDYTISPPFDDSRNINIGNARVIWVDACKRHPAGWALPGGRRTASRVEARECAVGMSKLMQFATQ